MNRNGKGRLMKVVRLVAWDEAGGRARRGELDRLGHEVVFELSDPGKLLRTLREWPPVAVVIDLSRKPGQGRDLGVALRVRASTRHIPLVFLGGSPESMARVKKVLPDAEVATWEEADSALRRALEAPPGSPVVPDSILAGYSGTPLPKKLGIKAGTQVLLAGAPRDFEAILGRLPEGATLVRRFRADVELILWFVRSRRGLEAGMDKWVSRVGKGGIWILWPKKSSGIQSDLKQDVVRRTGLNAGLVDYKIAAIDQDWSGLKFALRR